VRSFACAVCGNALVFENSVCVSCGTAQGFDPRRLKLVPVGPDEGTPCLLLGLAGCNWLVPPAEVARYGGLCLACRLTRIRPADDDAPALVAYARTEAAKRRLVYQLLDLALPVVPKGDDAWHGLAYDLLSSAVAPVITGHEGGVVTIDLAEGQDAHREAMRVELAEPYRTLLGHLRHETGHYYWTVLVAGPDAEAGTLDGFRSRFGDERADYGGALDRHYAQGPQPGWGEHYVSAYAAAHPWEDWAETFAHYLHIRDTLQTAAAYGMVVTGPGGAVRDAAGLIAVAREPVPEDTVEALVATWLPLTYALNAVNRSLGKDDLYPFVLTPAVISKLGFVHELVRHTT
jgi:hypothetical protein